MPSNLSTKFSALLVGAAALSTGALTTIANIYLNSGDAHPGIFTGDVYLVTADNATPSIRLDQQDGLTFQSDGDIETGSGDLLANPLRNPEFCTGFSGALMCQRLVVLTSSGGKPGYSAGSFVCSSATCSNVSALFMPESNPKASNLSIGWTNAPLTSSGVQFISRAVVSSGADLLSLHGSGSVTVPLNATVKAVWGVSNPNAKAAVLFRYTKFYTP